jgi:diadenosine tetraphosphate (Ap4A) HIT family hydrolase
MHLQGCYTCEQDVGGDLPERLYADDRWRVAHAFDSALPGWLVVVPRRHVRAMHELDADEALGLGALLRAVSTALVEVTGCVKTYVIQFAEQEGFGHVHFHVVPRMPDIPTDHRGPAVFGYLVRPPGQGIDEQHRDDLAAALRARLNRARTYCSHDERPLSADGQTPPPAGPSATCRGRAASGSVGP